MTTSLLEHPVFATDFARLRGVTLDPSRHTLPDAEATLGLVHDIGKTEGTTSPAKSVELLPRYGITDGALLDLVRSWFLDESTRRGLLARPLVLDA